MTIRNYLAGAILAFASVGATAAVAAPNPPSNVIAQPRYNDPITIVLSWNDNSNDEDNFEIQRREAGGVFSFLTAVASNTTSFEDATATASTDWEYRVRARSATTGNSPWAGPSIRTRPRQVWPLPDGDHDILHSFGTPLNFGANQYFHEGVDISSSNVRVDAARGGVVTNISAPAVINGTTSLSVDMGAGGMATELFTHIGTDPALSVGDVLAPGDQVGTVRNNWFNRAFEADHTHWGDRQTNKLIPFVNSADRDPNNQAPHVADINNDGDDFIVVPANNNNHNNPREPAWGDVDFLVDAFDDMAPTNDLMVAPFNIGYWIEARVAGGQNVRSAASPYRLIQFDFPLIGPGAAGARENATMYWPLDADIQGLDTWQSTLTWILTNTNDATGASGTQQAGELWRTDARVGSGTKANSSDSARARENQEAKYPDGIYHVHILLADLINSSEAVREVLVDNSRPYVKSVKVFSGAALAYAAQWLWSGSSASLEISPATFEAASAFPVARTRDVTVEIEFSEPMRDTPAFSIAPLAVSPILASDQPEKQRTIWRGTVSHLDIDDDGSDDGQQTLTITGADLAGNQLLQISDRNSIGANNHNRDTAGALRGTPGSDVIHGFEIGALEGLLNVVAIFMRNAPTDPVTPVLEQKALELTNWLNEYYGEVAYNEITFNVTNAGWYALDQPLASYYTLPQHPLVDMVQEAISDAEADGVDLDSTDFVLVVTDETSSRDEWSTSGGWPYETNTGVRPIAAGVLNLASPRGRVTNLTGRMIGLLDLFAYPEVSVPRPFVGPWSHMSDRDTEVHVLGWEKWRAGWLDETGTASGKTVEIVNKPPVSAPISNRIFTLGATDTDTDETKVLAIEIGNQVYYTTEYRRQSNLDAALPDAGVVITKADDRIKQGEGPAIIQESPVSAGDLSDAPFIATGTRRIFDDVGSGVNLEVTSIDPGTAEVRLNYAVPPFENDVFVADHDDRWKTIDIWVDAPDLAGNFAADPRSVIAANEKPVVGELNKLIGRFRNNGAADATNFEVEMEILEPWGTGGTWRRLEVRTVPLIQGTVNNAGDDFLLIADWTPQAGTHTCVRLRARSIANDINTDNNFTQENIHEFVSTSGSPYQPIISRFQVENPFSERLPIFFRMDGLPAGWSYVINPARPVIDPGQTITAQVIVQPSDGAPKCVREEATLTAYAPRVDTLKSIGAITLAIALKSPGTITHESWTDCNCDCPDDQQRHCRVYTRACTKPGLPNTQVNIAYTGPDGITQIHTVTTDAQGCVVDFLPVDPNQGVWQTKVELPENECRAGDRSPPTRVIVEPRPEDLCHALKLRLQQLTSALVQAMETGEKDLINQLHEEIQRILEPNQDCQELRQELRQLYREAVAAFFQGDQQQLVEIMDKILTLIAT